MKKKLLILMCMVLVSFTFVSASFPTTCNLYGNRDITNNGTHLFVLSNDNNNGEVCLYDIYGNSLGQIATANGDLGGITTDGTYLYINDQNSDNILKWNMDGTDTGSPIEFLISDDENLDYKDGIFIVGARNGIYKAFINGTVIGQYIDLMSWENLGMTYNGTHTWINLQDMFSIPENMRRYEEDGVNFISYPINGKGMTNNGTHIWMLNDTHILFYDMATMNEITGEILPPTPTPTVTPSGSSAGLKMEQLPTTEQSPITKVSLFQGIKNWFQNILNWFKGLF